jgi:ParB-like chromosome segregation protein Spo0J
VERNVDGPAAERSVPLDARGQKLRALRLCRPNTDEHIRRSLQQRGQLTALTAFDNGGQLELVDGFKRLRAARRLGWTQLRVVVLA